MNRVEEIVALQQAAAGPEADASARRWAEAKLIYEELEVKSYRILSAEIKAAGGSGSIGHLQRMYRAWWIMVVQPGIEYGDFGDMPPFNRVYDSEEVRDGAPDRERRPRKRQVSQPHGRNREQDDDYSGHGLVTQAHRALSLLANNPAFLPLLSDSDWATIRALWPLLETITASYVPRSQD